MEGGGTIEILKLITEMITRKIQLLDERIQLINETKLKFSEREKWNLETGEKFNELISCYPISEDELLKMSRVLCDFVMITRITDIDEYFFVGKDRENPRLPFMLKWGDKN